MKSSPKRLFAGILALVLLLSAGCTGTPGKPPVAMGRYVESELALPADFAMVAGLRKMEDGAIELLAYPQPEEGAKYIYLHLYRSPDGGATWTDEAPAWLDLFNGEESEYGVECAAWAPDGTLWFYAQAMTNEEYAPTFARLDGDTLTLMDWPDIAASDGAGFRSFQIAENGDLIIDCWSEFLQVDSATGKVKNIYTAPAGDGGSMNDGWAVTGNTLALSEAARIAHYDLTTGKEISAAPCQGPSANSWSFSKSYRVMDFGSDGALYFADPKGVYRLVEGNDTLEQLSDGSLTSLATPSVNLQRLVALDGQYLVLSWSNEVWKLLSYTYDPDIPTLPDTALNIWSLTDDPLIAQAVSAMQKSDPGVHVIYTVGMTEDGSVTREDAIRAINTQLLAGKGPDVLVLDGLPVYSYVEKGVLADISAQLGTLDATGALLSNIVSAYRQPDGKVYAVPAQFQVPMLHGSDEAMSAIRDLETMADWLEGTKGSFRSPFIFSKAKNMLRALYPACVSTLTTPDGNMDEVKLKDFLAQMKRILDLRMEVDESDEYNDWADSIAFDFGPLAWTTGNSALDLGNLSKFQGLYPAWTASDKKGDGSIDTLFGVNSYLPVTSLGISAQSGQQALAWKFVEAALSDEVQHQAVGKGIPVSAAAFDASTADPQEREDGVFSHYGTTFTDAEGASVPVNMQVLYPPEEYRQEMAERLKGLDTPIFYDESVLQIIIDGTRDFWSGKVGVDATAGAIMQKLELYEAE